MRRPSVLVLASIVLASCVSNGSETTTTTSTTASTTIPTTTTTPRTTSTTPPPTSMESGVYFFFDGYPVEPGPYLVPVARVGDDEIDAVLTMLLEGVTDAEATMGLSTAIPEGTHLLGVEVAEGVAAIDLSSKFDSGGGSLSVLGRVAQIVYTATRFDEIDAVEFLIEGAPVDVLTGEGLIVDRPQTRADYTDLLPAILVEEPTWGSRVESRLDVFGLAISGSGVVSYVVVDADGLIVAEGETPVAHPGQRAEFGATVDLSSVPHPGEGSIIVFETGPDGTQLHVLEYPLTIGG